MSLVNECHQKGIAVILDVVYNHLGPEGNNLEQFGHYFSERYSTPWGKPINFDGPHSDQVRNYFIQNALMWLRDFHIDGLRLDAVHAIYDFSAKHIMQEIPEKVELLQQQTGRRYYLIAESNLNDIRYINPHEKGGFGLDVQWSDDFHHALHVLATGEKNGYYSDFGEPGHLAKSIGDTFIYEGQYSNFRKKSYGNSAKDNPAEQFVVFSQNHDQVGNRKNGERLISLTGFEMAKAIAGTLFITPNIPMLFMGEEYGENNPFYYFVSHLNPELNKLVKEGRQEEFREFGDNYTLAPDPAAVETFNKSKLSWDFITNEKSQAMFDFYKKLIVLRKSNPALGIPDKNNLKVAENNKVITVERWHQQAGAFSIMNFNDHDVEISVEIKVNTKLHKIIDSANNLWLGPGEKSPDLILNDHKVLLSKESIVIYSNQNI